MQQESQATIQEKECVAKAAEPMINGSDSFMQELGKAYAEEGLIPNFDVAVEMLKFFNAFTCGCRLLKADTVAEKMDRRYSQFIGFLQRCGYSPHKWRYDKWTCNKATLNNMIAASAYAGRID